MFPVQLYIKNNYPCFYVKITHCFFFSTYQTRQEEILRSTHLYPAHVGVALASPDVISSSTPEIPTPQNTANPAHAPRGYMGAFTTSPDLAYGSLNPSADELSKWRNSCGNKKLPVKYFLTLIWLFNQKWSYCKNVKNIKKKFLIQNKPNKTQN